MCNITGQMYFSKSSTAVLKSYHCSSSRNTPLTVIIFPTLHAPVRSKSNLHMFSVIMHIKSYVRSSCSCDSPRAQKTDKMSRQDLLTMNTHMQPSIHAKSSIYGVRCVEPGLSISTFSLHILTICLVSNSSRLTEMLSHTPWNLRKFIFDTCQPCLYEGLHIILSQLTLNYIFYNPKIKIKHFTLAVYVISDCSDKLEERNYSSQLTEILRVLCCQYSF